MKLDINTKKMTFDEENNEIEHEIILNVQNKEFYGYDVSIESDDKFIEDTFKDNEFEIREQKTWNSFPLYKIVDGKIVKFNWKNYSYFSGTDRRNMLASKINEIFSLSSELKILRKTLKFILDKSELDYPEFTMMNNKIEEVIKKNPKR